MNSTSGRTFLDTNVLVYAFDLAEPEKQERAWDVLLDKRYRGRVVISTQVLSEFYVTVTRRIPEPLTEKMAEQALQSFMQLPVMQVDGAMVLAAARRNRGQSLSYWDALIVEAAKVAGCTRLLTEDHAFGSEIEGLQIENPFL